jgi:hypothetical protein
MLAELKTDRSRRTLQLPRAAAMHSILSPGEVSGQ